ncbi:MAG: nitroreductase family deazaflavin-dependent oxidoreductase [Candidatus Dormibacteraceae bacterium]
MGQLTDQAATRASARRAQAPAAVGFFNGVVTRLARLGVPLGPNALLTVRGRKSGLPRTTPVAIIEVSGRRWIQSPFGHVDWTRNLRAAGEATLARGRRQEPVSAVALSEDEAAAFFTDVLGPSIAQSAFSRMMGRRLGLTAMVADPRGAAATHPVFELLPRS